jgi:DNA-binding NarL/FixJ family response regulator
MISLEIFETCPIYGHGLREICRDAGFSVGTVKSSSAEGMSWRADVFLVEPRAVGDALLPEFLIEAQHIAPVLLIAATQDERVVRSYHEHGASGVVDRHAEAAVLVEAIRTVVQQGHCWAPPETGPGIPAQQSSATESSTLSPRELQVIRQIARGRTHAQIARSLGISPHTVDTYVKRIRQKLVLGNKAELTRAAVLGQFGRLDDAS